RPRELDRRPGPGQQVFRLVGRGLFHGERLRDRSPLDGRTRNGPRAAPREGEDQDADQRQDDSDADRDPHGRSRSRGRGFRSNNGEPDRRAGIGGRLGGFDPARRERGFFLFVGGEGGEAGQADDFAADAERLPALEFHARDARRAG